MLPAELRGKVSPTQPPTERMEDVLTSHVFSLFRYLNELRIPLLFLAQAVNLLGQSLQLGAVRWAHPFFWPKYRLGTSPRLREFDVVLVLELEGRERLALGVENKYRSGPSNTAADAATEPAGGEAEAPAFTGNQLADEFLGLRQGQWFPAACGQALAATRRRVLLYVTRDYVLPRQELVAAVASVPDPAGHPVGAPRQVEQDLYWLGWRALHRLLTEERRGGFNGSSPGEQRLLDDLLRVLDRRDLQEFRPFERLTDVTAYPPMFPGGVIPDHSATTAGLTGNLWRPALDQ